MKSKQSLIVTETMLFLSIFKWVGLASIIGGAVGIATTFFLKLLSWSTGSISSIHPFFFLPLTLFFSIILIHYVSPDSKGHGTEKVIEAVHKRFGLIRFRVIPIKLLATILTIASGGSAGKEGPSAQIGGGMASTFSNLLNFTHVDRKKLVICGISAGFAAVFGTPIAGAIFAVEVLFVGNMMYDVLLPSFVAGMVSFQIAALLGVHHSYHLVDISTHFDPVFFIVVVCSGLFFGLVSIFFIEVMNFGEDLSSRFKVWEPLKGVFGGVLLIGFALIFSPDYLGLGLDFIDKTLSGYEVIWYAFIVKAIVTSITLSFGGSGGILTPLFFIGVTAGSFFATVFGVDVSHFAAIGFVSVLAGAANTPIAASILAIELFGPSIAPYASLACVVSFLMTGNKSVYPSQVMAMKKTAVLQNEQGREVCDTETKIDYKTRKLMVTGRNLVRRFPVLKKFKKKQKGK
jgi:H+/Cl- antiporter ClcA